MTPGYVDPIDPVPNVPKKNLVKIEDFNLRTAYYKEMDSKSTLSNENYVLLTPKLNKEININTKG